MLPIVPFLALLHPAAQLGWRSFTVHWSTVAGLAALSALYEWRVRVHRARAETAEEAAGPTTLQHASFVSGLLLIFLSLNGPLHDISDYYLFSGHMVQHLMLTLWMPPLLLYGTPGYLLRPALQYGWVFALAKRLTTAGAAFLIFNVTVTVWHLPPMYNTAMEFHSVHIVQHLMFMVTATLMWWPLMSPLLELPRLSYPGQVLYCFLMSIPMSIVAVCIAMASEVLYPAYSSAARIWGITPLLDQQIGGLIMWIPGGLFFLVVATVVFYKWSASGSDSKADAQLNWKPAAQ
jgi:putative membrane protein